MPLYTYLCGNNHKTVQIRLISLPIAELEKSVCVECEQPAELIPSVPARPIFVGSGFHQNDYQHGPLGS